MSSWYSQFEHYAILSFGVCATLELCILLYPYVFGSTASDLFSTLIRFIFINGIFLWLLENYQAFAGDVIRGFQDVATGASGSVQSGNIFSDGVTVIANLGAHISVWHPQAAFAAPGRPGRWLSGCAKHSQSASPSSGLMICKPSPPPM